jgi:hypothetical protein
MSIGLGDLKIEGMEEAKKLLSPERLKKVLLKTINDTAYFDVKSDLKNEMQRVFDRPTPYTLNSVFTRLNPGDMSVDIGLKEWGGKGTPASEYLKPQIFGGTRPKKRSESYLGRYYVPGAAIKLNKYGNISGAQITEVGYMANITPGSRKRKKRPRNYFIIRSPGRNLKPGVYEKMANGSIRPMLFFIEQPHYEIRLRWNEVIADSISRNIQRRFNEAFEAAFSVTLP